MPPLNINWLPLGDRPRFGVGIVLTCFVHDNCELEIYFENPADTFDPVPAPIYYRRHGTGLGSLTVTPRINMGEHGVYEICRGAVSVLVRLH